MVQPSYRWDLQGLYCLSAVTVSLLHAHACRGLFLHGWPDDIQVGLCQQAAKMYALMSVEPANSYRQLQFATWAGHFAIFDQVRAAETVGAMCRHNGPSRGHGPAMTWSLGGQGIQRASLQAAFAWVGCRMQRSCGG